MALIPGLPTIPFLLLAAIAGALSYGLFRANVKQREAAREIKPPGRVAEAQVTVTLPVFLQVGPDLLPYVDLRTEQGQTFYDKSVQLRNALYVQLGIMFPPIQISGDLPQLEHNYVIWLNEVPIVQGRVRADSRLVNCPADKLASYGINGENTVNPATGKPATWIARTDQEKTQAAGFPSWDTHEVLVLHLASFLRKHAVDFVGIQEVQWMLNAIKQYYPALVDEVTPKPVSLQQLTDILSLLAAEGVSIRDLKTILQCLGEWSRVDQNTVSLAERVRTALKRKICYGLTEGKSLLFVYQLDPELQDLFRNSIRQSAAGVYLAMNPQSIDAVLQATHKEICNLPPTAQRPVIITDKDIRRFVKKTLERDFPDLAVISYAELTPEIKVQSLGIIGRYAALEISQSDLVGT
jgi:type III secretion protein V